MAIGLGHYLTVPAILFTLGVFGIFLNRKNVIVILMSIELMLNAVNINLMAFSMRWGHATGQVFALFVLTVADASAITELIGDAREEFRSVWAVPRPSLVRIR